MTKPFDMKELVARIHAVLRRTRPPVEKIRLGQLVIDFVARSAIRGGAHVRLLAREFDFLRCLAERGGAPVHRDKLLAEIWGIADGSTTRSVDFFVARLRKKIEPSPHTPQYLRAVHGDGYSLTFELLRN